MALGIERGCEAIMTELLLTMLENLIYDITGSVIKKWKGINGGVSLGCLVKILASFARKIETVSSFV